MSAGIQLERVTKAYPGSASPAVERLSLCVEAGSIVTLLGPSGCGKTTSLRLIAGFERPDIGTITLGERTVAGPGTWVPPERRGIGMVFQEHALFPHLTVAANIGFNLKGPDRAARIEDAIELVGLSGMGTRMPQELSGGQQQRVALARALAHRPLVMLFDEPFSSLDADLRVQMRVEVRRILKEAEMTAVFVSHDQRDALAISDRVIIMRDGSIEQIGAPREVYQFPETRFAAEFLGRTNILEGTIVSSGAVSTTLGILPSRHTHDLAPGMPVVVSVRPESFEIDPSGELHGRVVETTYAGSTIDAVITTTGLDGDEVRLMVHAHPELELSVGDVVPYTVLPEFVAVIQDS